MKKIIGTTLIIVGAFSFALAETNQGTGERQIRPMMPRNLEQKIENRLDERGTMMTTGSSTIDSQIKTLVQERDLKIKAINDEYATKLKALIGDKRILPTPAIRNIMNASGTIMQKFEDRKDNNNEERRNSIMQINASSTDNASGTVKQFIPRQSESRNFFRNIPFLNKFFGSEER